jgi:hypothetical protein
VSGAAMAEKMTQAISSQMDAAIQQTKKLHDEATDEATKKIYADMLAAYETSQKESASNQESDPALAHNRRLLARYENELNAYASELAKYTDNEEDAQKSVDEWQKQLDKAAAEARKQ